MAEDHAPNDAPLSAAKHREGIDRLKSERGDAAGDHAVGRAVTIARPVAEVYARFRDFAAWPSFMENVVSITPIDPARSHWVVKAPAGKTVEWDASVTEEEPGRMIAWEAEQGADVPNSGRVTFRDAGTRGTVVTATILYDPPAGVVGKLVAKLFQREPAIQARRDLRRFKQLLETGEVATAAMNQRQHEGEDA